METLENQTIGALLTGISREIRNVSNDVAIVKNDFESSKKVSEKLDSLLNKMNDNVTVLKSEIYGAKDDGDGGLKTRVKHLEEIVKSLQDKYQQSLGVYKFFMFLVSLFGFISTVLSLYLVFAK